MISHETKLATAIEFLKGSVLAGVSILFVVAAIHSCETSQQSELAQQRMREQCMIQCHPNKSQYLEVDQTCLCDTNL